MKKENPSGPEVIEHIKTNAFERRLSVIKASVIAGAKLTTQSLTNWAFNKGEERTKQHKKIISQQADYLVKELGKLKGSVVKAGQMMALWGEHFLPNEITAALHTLENQTAIVPWYTIKEILEQQLGSKRLAELSINPNPIGAASLGQVHLATRHRDNQQICLKVQYPGIAKAIDSDLKTLSHLIRLTHLVPMTSEFKQWFEEVRQMLHREVDYPLEQMTTEKFRQRLINDKRYIVPNIFPEYSSECIVATSYEPGIAINSPSCQQLEQKQRNQIAAACLDLCWQEVFSWGEMQTDPNFGNYFIRLNPNYSFPQVILLDFGAVRAFSETTLTAGKELVIGAFHQDIDAIKKAILKLQFIPEQTPDQVWQSLGKLCCLAIEPFTNPKLHPVNPKYFTKDGAYRWAESDLVNRVISSSSQSAFSRFFTLPPKEFMFLSRKIMGAYTLMTVLNAEVNGAEILSQHINT